MNDRELDAEFERIISGWDEEASDPQVRAESSAPHDQAADRATAGEAARPAADAVGDHPTDAAKDRVGDSMADPGAASGANSVTDASADSAADPVTEPRADSAADPTSTGLTLSIAPTTPHVWRGSPTPEDDVDAVLEESDPDEHFEPPTLTDLPNAEDDPMFWAIVVGLGGGPLLLLYLLIFDREGSGWWVATALAMTVVGFVLLVLRGGNERDPFDDGTRI